MKDKAGIQNLIARYPMLSTISKDIVFSYEMMRDSFVMGGKLLVAGNGGSAADAEHIAGELMKRFMIHRSVDAEFAKKLISLDEKRGRALAENLEVPLMTIPLVAHESMITAYMNDVDATGVFAQQLLGYGKKGDVFLGISTSGNSENIINAALVAKALDIKIIALTGKSGGELSKIADVSVKVPEEETYLIQELHLPIYHYWCMALENHFFGEKSV